MVGRIQRSCSRYIYTHNHLPDLFTHLTIDESFSCGRCGVVIKLILLLLLHVSTVLSIYLPIMPSSRVFLFLIFFLCTVVSCRPSPHDYMPLCLRFMPSANDSSFFSSMPCVIYIILIHFFHTQLVRIEETQKKPLLHKRRLG